VKHERVKNCFKGSAYERTKPAFLIIIYQDSGYQGNSYRSEKVEMIVKEDASVIYLGQLYRRPTKWLRDQ